MCARICAETATDFQTTSDALPPLEGAAQVGVVFLNACYCTILQLQCSGPRGNCLENKGASVA